MLLAILGVSLLGNLLICKAASQGHEANMPGRVTIRAGEGTIRAGEGTNRVGEYFNAGLSFNKF